MNDKTKKQDPSVDLVIRALKNIQSLLRPLGAGVLSPTFVKWLETWNGKDFDTVDKLSMPVVGDTIIIDKGKVTGDGKTLPLKSAIKVDNILIVVHGNNGTKNNGKTFLPKKNGDRIVIFMDATDVNDELKMKSILFHELVHEKQLRDPKSGFKDIRDKRVKEDDGKTGKKKPVNHLQDPKAMMEEPIDDKKPKKKGKKRSDADIIQEIKDKLTDNFEAEAHLGSLFFSALLFQAHPEGKESIEGKGDSAAKKFASHGKDVYDSLALLQQILATLRKLVEDIAGENALLKQQIDSLKTLREKLKKEIKRYGDSLPVIKKKGSSKNVDDKIRKDLADLEKKIAKTDELIQTFEKTKLSILKQEAAIRKKLAEAAEQRKQIDQKKAELAKATDKAAAKALKKAIADLEKAFKKQQKAISDEVAELVKGVKQAIGNTGKTGEANKALKGIEDAINGKKSDDINDQLKKAEDNGIIDVLIELLRAFRKSSNIIDKIRFKLMILRRILELAKTLPKKDGKQKALDKTLPKK